MLAQLPSTNTRYASTAQHNIHRCEQGLAPILGATCRCRGTLFGARRGDGPFFFEALPATDLHSFKILPSRGAIELG